MASVRARLREAIAERAALLAPGVYDGLSAALNAAAGFKIAYMSGAAVSVATGIPQPPAGLATLAESWLSHSRMSGFRSVITPRRARPWADRPWRDVAEPRMDHANTEQRTQRKSVHVHIGEQKQPATVLLRIGPVPVR